MAAIDRPPSNPAPTESIPSQNLEKAVLEQKWDSQASEVDKIVDGLGKGIDQGIKESVIALNVLDINTTQSCEGHLDWATGAPYIDVGAKDLGALRETANEARERAEQAYNAHASREEEGKLWHEFHEARKAADKENLKEARKVLDLLNEFYTDRTVPSDQRLIINGSGRFTRLESQGAMFQETAEPEVKAAKLPQYQEEMRAFTEFLKGKFFGQASPSPTPTSNL